MCLYSIQIGVTARKTTPITLDFLVDMLNDCFESMRKDFEKK